MYFLIKLFFFINEYQFLIVLMNFSNGSYGCLVLKGWYYYFCLFEGRGARILLWKCLKYLSNLS